MKKNKPLAVQIFKRSMPELVSDACQLEGINFTVPDIQTILGGVAVGGKTLYDHEIAVNQINAWKLILEAVEKDEIVITIDFSNKVHALAAKNDAMVWGEFRSGFVTIAGTAYTPPEHHVLNVKFTELLEQFSKISNEYEKAIYLFLMYAKNQFYFDNNKRQGRFMMNAYLLQQGLPVISIPKTKENEFNYAMIRFYESEENDMAEMHEFMMSCLHPRIAKEFEIPIFRRDSDLIEEFDPSCKNKL